MQRKTTKIVELPPDRTAHIRKHFPQPLAEAPSGVDLPYHALGGEGLERLCALLLIADGQTPRYFGTRGTSDYGVDLVVSDGATSVVYQCKNVTTYTKGDLSRWLDNFEQPWLVERPHLPRPVKYVLVCPPDIREKDEIEKALADFYRRNKVRVVFWQKTLLDERLKRLPDIVADLFSATVADFFCSLDQRWDDGFTAALAPAGRGARAVDRFLGLHDEARFVPDADHLDDRLDLLRDEGLVAFIGASGSGKTMAALDLASYMAEEGWRPWHVDMRNADPIRLFESIERRALRPSVFVFDDCHLALDRTLEVLSRIRTAGLYRRVRLILTVTTTASVGDRSLDQGEISKFIAEEIEPQQIVVVHPKEDMYGRIIATARPDLAEIPKETVQRLLVVTGGDLFLLDEALRAMDGSGTDDARALAEITVETLQEAVLTRYFDERYPSAITIRRIAAVAQFDLSVPKDAIEAPPDRLRHRMLVSTGPPPAWLFAHAALAELIGAALSILEANEDPNEFVIDAIVTHGLGEMTSDRWVEGLIQILRARLKLIDDSPLKRRLLLDDRVLRALQDAGTNTPLSAISLACFLTRDGDASSPYVDLLSDRIEKVLSGANEISTRDALLFGMALRNLRLADAEEFEEVLETADPKPLVRALSACAGLPAAMRILQYVTPGFADRFIAALDADTVDALVKRTIDEGRSVGTIGLALRELGGRDADQRQLAAFETRLGPHRMIHLIRERADLPATMRVLEHVTPGFADKLIAALDADTVDALVKRTIDEGRSVGTIGLALRELGGRDADQRQLAAFETRLGPHRMVRLIRERADLPAAMRVLRYVTPGFADRLIAALDADTVDALVKRTIDEGRSVGTIGLVLRELGDRDADQRQLAAFETRLGPHRMNHLIRERADLPAAMKILQYVTPGFADRLIAALDADTLDTLVDNTIYSDAPNIRHLPLSRRFFAHLEGQLPPEAWWRLISGCGDLAALSSIFVALGARARTALVAALLEASPANWAAILARTDAYGLSVFLSDTEPLLTTAARAAFEDAAVAGMDGVVTGATWDSLAVAHKGVSDLQRESRATKAFLEHFRARVGAVDLASPPALDALTAAASLVQILWHERAQDRSAVANAIFDIVPKVDRWPLDHERLIGARLLLALAQSEEIPQPVAERLFDACAWLPDKLDITTLDAKTLFLYLFNVWAVVIARAPRGIRTLAASQNEGFWTRLLDHVDTLACDPGGDDNKLKLLALVGLLEFTSIISREELDRRVRGVVKGFGVLLNIAEKEKFVGRFFAFRGLAMIGPPRIVNERGRILRLLDAFETYEFQTPALRLMRDHLSSRRGHSPSPTRHLH